MYDNIGENIKTLAVIFFVLGVLGSIIGTLAIWILKLGFFLGLVVLAGGLFSAWILFCFVYGFGALVSNSQQIAINTQRTANKQQTQSQQVDYLAKYKTQPEKTTMTCPHCRQKISISKNERNCPSCFLNLYKD